MCLLRLQPQISHFLSWVVHGAPFSLLLHSLSLYANILRNERRNVNVSHAACYKFKVIVQAANFEVSMPQLGR